LDADLTVLMVLADYECYPTWMRGSVTTNVDPQDLSLSAGLAQQLVAWAHAYDDTLNRDDPTASGFANAEAEAAFHARGEALARQLAREASGRYRVEYFDARTGVSYPVSS
jgi:hypothetical protein